MSATKLHRILAYMILGLSAVFSAGGPAQAEISPVVTEADIERARRETPMVTEQDIELARQKYALPSDADRRSAPQNSPKATATAEGNGTERKEVIGGLHRQSARGAGAGPVGWR